MVMKENEGELSLFFEMRRRENAEKEKDMNLLSHHNSDNSQLDAPPGSKPVVSPKTNFVSSIPVRRTRIDEFLNSENDKNDYDWLLTPPGNPLVQSLEMESQKTKMSQIENPTARPTALKSRLSNLQVEPTNTATKGNVAPKQPTFASGQNSSGVGSIRPSSSGGSTPATSRPATPTGRPSLPATVKSSRASTLTSRATLTSTKPTVPPARSSTPKLTVRPSSPTARSSVPTSKLTSKSSTPTNKSSNVPPGCSSSVPKAGPTVSQNPVPSRGSSPTMNSRLLKPSEKPGFSNGAPSNLRTSLTERTTSASGGMPGAASVSKRQVRQQSGSLSIGKASSGSGNKSGGSVSKVNRTHFNDGDNVNPVIMGTKMVERVVNMRKLAPPKLDGHLSMSNDPVGGKSSSANDSSGFGLSLSKTSLDMAIRHMDIRRSVSSSGSLRPLVTSIPASSMYSTRSGPPKISTTSVSNCPHTRISNSSSEPSAISSAMKLDVNVSLENDLGSEGEDPHPPASVLGNQGNHQP